MFPFRQAFAIDSYDDGESSVGSRGSKPVNGYSLESGSLHNRTNTTNNVPSRLSEGPDKSSPVKLRNNSLNLGSDVSSYDDPYSSVDEIGVDLSSVHPPPPLPTGMSDHDLIHSPVNPLYDEVVLRSSSVKDGDSGSVNSHAVINPICCETFPEEHPQDTTLASQPETEGESSREEIGQVNNTFPLHDGSSESSMEGNEYFSSSEDKCPFQFPYEDLVLPPPPTEFSDLSENKYDLTETHEEISNGVTDF